jgi:serine/threonine protein phosphatase PrpC
MAIRIFQPISFSELGQRDNNEDYFSPTSLDTSTRLFMVCDGMGGLDKGEEASERTAETINQYFLDNPFENLTEEYLQKAVETAFYALKSFMETNSLISRMGTTLTLLHINAYGATVAHVGDSRVYHIRAGKILYKTKDHKQVLDMVEEGIITAEQAVNHPWRNRLSRSVSVRSATSEDESPRKPDKPTVQHIEDLEKEDYFFLCSDGVLEQVTDEILCEILVQDKSNEAKIDDIIAVCKDKTKDNYTGILVQISEVSDEVLIGSKVEEVDSSEEGIEFKPRKKKSNVLNFTLLGIFMFAVGFVGFRVLKDADFKVINSMPILFQPSKLKYHNRTKLNNTNTLYIAQDEKNKFGIINQSNVVIERFEYDEICVMSNLTHIRLIKNDILTNKCIASLPR